MTTFLKCSSLMTLSYIRYEPVELNLKIPHTTLHLEQVHSAEYLSLLCILMINVNLMINVFFFLSLTDSFYASA